MGDPLDAVLPVHETPSNLISSPQRKKDPMLPAFLIASLKIRQRRALLKDALRLIDLPNIRVKPNFAYVGFYPKGAERNADDSRPHRPVAIDIWAKQKAPFHTSLLKRAKVTECSVCALGVLFLAHVDRFDQVNVHDIDNLDRPHILRRLHNVFDAFELKQIEAVFEAGHDLAHVTVVPLRGLLNAAGALQGKARLKAMLQFLLKSNTQVV